jgi:hypothetical protein
MTLNGTSAASEVVTMTNPPSGVTSYEGGCELRTRLMVNSAVGGLKLNSDPVVTGTDIIFRSTR